MKKTNLLFAGLGLLATGIVAVPVYASTTSTPGLGTFMGRGEMHKNMSSLTAEQQAVMEQKMKTRTAENTAKMEAVDKAMAANDYDAWVVAVGKDSPMASKITKENFPKLIEAHNLMKQAREKMKELGLEDNAGMKGFGGGRHFNK